MRDFSRFFEKSWGGFAGRVSSRGHFEVVGARGFEPPTSRSQTERTTRLCYAPSLLRKLGNLPNRRAILAVASQTGQGHQEFAHCGERQAAVTDSVLSLGR
jgi:hypothetical protein